MKILLVSGSPRLQGNTMQVLEACAAAIREQGVEARVLSLAGKDIRSCRACRSCHDDSDCVLRDDSLPLFQEIATGDGLIIGSPVYYGTARET